MFDIRGKSRRVSREEEEEGKEVYNPANYVKCVDAEYSKCEYLDYGIRCCKAGTMSHGAGGKSKWYCKEHFYKT